MSDRLFPSADAHVIDTNLFVAFERKDTVDLLRRAATDHEIVLSCPRRVYIELTPDDYPHGVPPVDDAIDAGWVEVLDGIDYENPAVSATMDAVREYIAAASDKPAHEVEQADAAVGGATTTLLERGDDDSVAVYTHDVAAFRGIERAVVEHGYDNDVHLVRAFDFVDAVEDRYRFRE